MGLLGSRHFGFKNKNFSFEDGWIIAWIDIIVCSAIIIRFKYILSKNIKKSCKKLILTG